MQHWSRGGYRVWIRIYVYPKTWAGYPFFKWRLNSKNWSRTVEYVRKLGYKVNAVYVEVEARSSGEIIYSERLV